MPFKSQAQRRKFGEMVKEGKMSKATFNEWNKSTPKNLPERASSKKEPTSIDQIRKKVTLGTVKKI